MAKETEEEVKPKYFMLYAPKEGPVDLGPSIFHDAGANLTLTSRTIPVKLTGRITKKIMVALKNNHIVEVEEDKALELIEAAAEGQGTTDTSQEAKVVKTSEAGGKSKSGKGKDGKGKDKTVTLGQPSLAESLRKMSTAELVQYYKDNYEVADKDVKYFEELTDADKIEYLLSDEN